MLSPAALADDLGINPLEAGTDAYLAAYPQLSPGQARAAAANSDARRAFYDTAAADAASFGGAWFDPAANVVHLAGTTDGATKNAAALGRRHGVVVRAHRVSHSAAELEAQADELRAGKGEIGQAAEGASAST